MRRLDHKVALVTGGASGLGKGIAQRLAAEGARVVISDVRSDVAKSTADECGLVFVPQDVRDERQWHDVIDHIEVRFGRLDILVNNAGVLGPMMTATPENTELSDWRRIFAVNVEGSFLGCRAAIPAMKRAGGGAIVNVSSMGAQMPTPDATAYGASKAAVRHLTKSVAQYCAQENLHIRCNSVHPGMVRTPLLDQAMKEIASGRNVPFAQIVAEHRSLIPLGDFASAEDVGAAVAFLVSDDARQVTGTALLVDGGVISCNRFRRAG